MATGGEHDRANASDNAKRAFLFALYLCLLIPWIVPAAMRAFQSNANSPLEWVSGDFEPRRTYDRFVEDFGAADKIILSWPGCRLDNPDVDRFVQSLKSSPAFQQQGKPLLHDVTSGRELFRVMTQPPVSLSPRQAAARLKGSVLGPDGQTTCVLIGFGDKALRQRTRLVPLVRAAAWHHCGVSPASLHLAGPVMDGYHVDQSSRKTMRQLAPLSSLVVLLVCYLCLDSVPATLLVFGISLVCQLVSMAIVDLSGGTVTALLVVLPPLVQVLVIAGGIHVVHYCYCWRPWLAI